jgi:hypothetical protein
VQGTDVRGIPGLDPHAAALGVLHPARAGLGAGRRGPGGALGSPVVPAAGAGGHRRGLGRAGPGRRGLRPSGRDDAIPRYRRAAARVGHGVGGRRRLCRTQPGNRARLVAAADAGARSAVVLLVPLALAGAARAAAARPPCVSGDPSSGTTVALAGDSHAAMWSPAFGSLAEQRHWRLETLTKVTCPPLDLPLPGPGVHRVRAVARRDPGPAAGRAPSTGHAGHLPALRR